MDRGTFNQCLAAFTGCLSVMMIGTSYGWTSVVLRDLLSTSSPVPMDVSQSSWMVAIINLGEILSPIPTGFLADSIGRKYSLLLTAPIYILSWILVLTTDKVFVLYIVRVLQGLGMGMVCTIVPMYLGEIAGPKIRGTISTFFSAMWYLGIQYEYILGPAISYHSLSVASLILPILFMVSFVWMPESPYYLLMKSREDEAKTSLVWLRGTSSVRTELDDMVKSVNEEVQTESLSNLTKSSDLRLLIAVQLVALVKFMSGFAAILSFATDTFTTKNHFVFTPEQCTIILGFVIILFTIISGYLVDRIGRRPLFMISTLGCAIFETLASVYYYLLANTKIDMSDYGWVAILTISLYFIFFSLGLSPLLPIIQAELFSSNLRGIASGITVSFGTVATFLSMKMYQQIHQSYGMYLNFAVYASFCYAGFLIIYYTLPETKGKTFAEIQKDTKNKKDPEFITCHL